MNRNVESLRVFTAPALDADTYDAARCLTFRKCEPADEVACAGGGGRHAMRYPISEVFCVEKLGNQDGLLVHLPSGFVEKQLIKVPGTSHWRLPPSHNSLERLVLACLTALQEEALNLSATDFEKATAILRDLLMLALSEIDGDKPAVSPVRSASLTRAKRFIRSRCEDANLTPSAVARESGLSLRYLHDLFRDEGQTVGQCIIYERLCKARRALEVGSPLTTSVSAVCFSSGFISLSHFSTAFKRAFSVSPIDVLRNRKAAREQNWPLDFHRSADRSRDISRVRSAR